MKKRTLACLVLVFFLAACQDKQTAKPNPFIKEQEMEQMLAELHIIDAKVRTYSLEKSLTQTKNYAANLMARFYQTYQTDSLTFYNNVRYYLSNEKKSIEITHNVTNRLVREQTAFEKKYKEYQKSINRDSLDAIGDSLDQVKKTLIDDDKKFNNKYN